LAEGQADNQRSRNEFGRLVEDYQGLTPATALINGTALTRQQLGQVKDAGTKLVWSPQSNLRLYGQTTPPLTRCSLESQWGWAPTGCPTLRVGTAGALGIDAAVHARNASAYDAVTATLSQGELFRVQAVLAATVGLLVLVRPRCSGWLAALGVGASALAAVLLYRYVDLGSLGPLPDMYENTWQVPGKLLSAYAEGAAVVLAGLGLLVHRGVLPSGLRSRCAGAITVTEPHDWPLAT
jgi:hypothetical protein